MPTGELVTVPDPVPVLRYCQGVRIGSEGSRDRSGCTHGDNAGTGARASLAGPTGEGRAR